ncbi:MAG: non-heme iron oxygenase ferredoxin subunit [Rhodospirillales bacterium]|nr:non-heme iron oxygenase ferredoxin subunit [Rhodospirillales bacterium]
MNTDIENWITVAERSSIAPGNVVGLKVGELNLALYNIDGTFYATDDVCTHAYALLSTGWLEGDVIECSLHGGQFDVKTGRGLGAPIVCDVKTFPVRISGNKIQVNVVAS